MQFIWTPKDIICGRIVCKNPEGKKFNPNDGWNAKWTKKIGYTGASSTYHPAEGELCASGVCLVSMTDGMVENAMSKEKLAEYLNKANLMPMPHEWFIQVMGSLRDCYEN